MKKLMICLAALTATVGGLLSSCNETILDDWNHNDEIVWTGEKGELIAKQAALYPPLGDSCRATWRYDQEDKINAYYYYEITSPQDTTKYEVLHLPKETFLKCARHKS